MSDGPQVELQIAVEAADNVPGEADFRRWVAAALPEGNQDQSLCIRVVDEDEGRALNRDYRGKDRPTNVLSFPFEAPPGVDGDFGLGDLVLCAPVVAREAAEQGKAPLAHWAHLTVHGTLHLLGYDHINEQEAETMEALEVEILQRLGFPNPYEESDPTP